MTKIIGSILIICFSQFSLMAQTNLYPYFTWDDDSLPASVIDAARGNRQYSGCWGMAVNNHEYAVLGNAGFVLVFDMTEPTQTELVGKYEGSVITTWREFKSYKNRLYAVSDGGGEEGLMIFDFSQAPDTIIRSYWSNEYFNTGHTITLDTISGHIYINGGSAGQGVIILDVSNNPDQPELLAKIETLPGGYIHDSYVRNDTLYASSGYNGYYIYDFKTDPQQPILLGSISTGGYNHNSWLTADGKYAYYTEEIPDGQPMQIVDLTELSTNGQLDFIGSGFLDNLTPGGTQGIPHNVYIKDNLLFNSQYEDGLLVYDISNPVAPVLTAHFDTYPQNTNYNKYFGNWGNYPWLPSGNIIAGDMQNGLFILGFSPLSSVSTPENTVAASLFPNPASTSVTILTGGKNEQWEYRIMNTTGQVVATGENWSSNSAVVNLTSMSPGLYFVEITTENGSKACQKLIIH